jgi:glutamate dehydrogenase
LFKKNKRYVVTKDFNFNSISIIVGGNTKLEGNQQKQRNNKSLSPVKLPSAVTPIPVTGTVSSPITQNNLKFSQSEIESSFIKGIGNLDDVDQQLLPPTDFIREVLGHLSGQEKIVRSSNEIVQLAITLWKQLADFIVNRLGQPYHLVIPSKWDLQNEYTSDSKNDNKIVPVPETSIEGASVDQASIYSNKNLVFTLIQRDRPFIVSTVAETLSALDLQVSLLLHPIFVIRREKISLLYVEVEKTSHAISSEKIYQELTDSLESLYKVTEDFSPMIFRLDKAASICERAPYSPTRIIDSALEQGQLIRWLLDESFIFLGLCTWDVEKIEKGVAIPRTPLGLLKEPNATSITSQVREDVEKMVKAGLESTITKLTCRSRILRRQYITHFVLSIPDESTNNDNQTRGNTLLSICGLFSSKVTRDECRDIPMLRVKLRELIEEERLFDNSYDYTYVVETLNRMPKDFALRLPTAILKKIVTNEVKVYHKNTVHLTAYEERNGRGVSLCILLSRDKFNREYLDTLQGLLEESYGVAKGTSEFSFDFSSQPQTRLYFFLPFLTEAKANERDEITRADVDIPLLTTQIERLGQSWDDALCQLIGSNSLAEVPNEWRLTHFPVEYRVRFSPNDALQLLRKAAELTESQDITAYFSDDNGLALVVLGLGKEVTLSRSIPIIEHLGFEVLSSSTFEVERPKAKTLFVNYLLLNAKESQLCIIDESLPNTVDLSCFNNPRITSGIRQIFLRNVENDILNSLLLSTVLSERSIEILRAFTALLWQVQKVASKGVLLESLASQPEIAHLLWEYIETKFDPAKDLCLDARITLTQGIEQAVFEKLKAVKDITQDRILRSLLALLRATIRVNFFNPATSDLVTLPLAMKLKSEDLEILPLPRPRYEIFVYGREVEGIHLRAGKVARGGLRWSERPEDFRTEVLGLMKTQKVKNVLIVPTGAKGGFIVRHLPTDSSRIPRAVEQAYRAFIRSLLSLTDNRKGDDIIHPPYVLTYDPADPYFVVAADKGTATFSDIANEIAAKEYHFWLGDAFASGGSNGYDHKKYGITARGTWECVKRHFHDLGICYTTSSFTVVGIGDMSGDVFGNGMLLSDNIQLIAAFNHRHIFIDPNPDPKQSFSERSRLFNIHRSQWSDYNTSLISEGGGVFNRADKAILLHPNIRERFDIAPSVPQTVNGEELINLILKAPCDLLWNGGIGTYIKSSSEANSEVNDGVNDRVRVDASELKAKVVGEGGNLGLTQKARVECAERGIRLNTDAIDNSAGVALSDREVNLKILFDNLISEGLLTPDRRDALLFEIDDEIVEQVLSLNHNHATLLTIAEHRSGITVNYFNSLIRELTRRGYINRTLDVLPDDDDLTERASKGEGLVRPELAMLLAGVKMWIKETILTSDLPSEPLVESYLIQYFPQKLQSELGKSLTRHPLKEHLIATELTNSIVDSTGISFVHRMCLAHGVSPVTVIKCAIAAEELLQSRELRSKARILDAPEHNNDYILLRRELADAVRHTAQWLIAVHGSHLSIRGIVELYQNTFFFFYENPNICISARDFPTFENRLQSANYSSFSSEVKQRLSLLPWVRLLLEQAWCQNRSHYDSTIVAPIRFAIDQKLAISDLVDQIKRVPGRSKWEQQGLGIAAHELDRSLSSLTIQFIGKGLHSVEEVGAKVSAMQGYDELLGSAQELLRGGNASPVAFLVLSKRIQRFVLDLE